MAESQLGAQVARHLRQDLLAPMELDGAFVGGVDDVVAQRPGEQDVGVRQDDRDRQSTKPISLENDASASAASSRRTRRARWNSNIAWAGIRWWVPTLTWAISPDEMSFIRVGRDNPSIVAASVVVKSSLVGTTTAPVVRSASSSVSTFSALLRGRLRVTFTLSSDCSGAARSTSTSWVSMSDIATSN